MTDKTYCTECPYFKYTNEDSDCWYGAKCEKDNHEAQPSMYAIKSLHDRCPLAKSGGRMTREEFMDIVYSELHSVDDYYRANRIINAADEYAKELNKCGYWRHYEGMLYCSKCGAEFYDEIMEYTGDEVPKYCPQCGQPKMQETEE